MKQSARRHLRLLGPVRVDLIQTEHNEAQENVQGVRPRFRSRRTVGILGFLVSERRSVARDLLSSLFWPDESPSWGRANLSRELHNLAQILPDCWKLDRQAVAFIPSADTTVDLYLLQDLETQERWGEAIELLGGDFLEGLYLDDNLEFENWLLAEQEHWQGRTEAILARVLDGHVLRGRYSDALPIAQRLLQLTPWNEEAHRQVMRLLAWTGKRGAALQQFKTCQRMLSKELDVEPALETIALYKQIQAGQLDLPPQLPAFLTEEKPRRKFDRPPFVARKGELNHLDAFLAGALTGESRVVFITGDPGMGKTALLDAFALRALEAYPNLLVAKGICTAYYGLGDPYLPFRDVMRMLTGDVEAKWDAGTISRDHARRLWDAFPLVGQALLDHGPHLLDVLIPAKELLSCALAAGQDRAPWIPRLREHIKRAWTRVEELEQSYLFQQVVDVLVSVAQEQPLLLILDDIQWADATSISLLFHLGRRIADADSRLLIICAYRPEEVVMSRAGEQHPLAKPLKEFKQAFGKVWVDLSQPEAPEGRIFVDELLNSTPNRLAEGFRDELFHRTEGHPLFTIELLRAMQERGDLLKNVDGLWIEGPTLDWELLPARVEAVIEERISRLDPELKEILIFASVEGEVFTAQVLAELLNVPERYLLRRLSQDLEREHRLVKEQEEIETSQRRVSRYRFSHFLFRDYLYKRLGLAEQRLLHGYVAAALEKTYEGRLDEMAVQLAHHFYQSGDHSQAFLYSSLAAKRADRVYDSGEAITHYSRAIQLAETVSPDVMSLADLHRGRGLAYKNLGALTQAHNDHTVTQQIAHNAGEHQAEWRALLDLGKLWASRDLDQARYYYEAALELARRLGEPSCLADNLNWMGNWYINDGNPNKAIAHHQEALTILKDLGKSREVAITFELLAFSNLVGSDPNASIRNYDRAITIFRELDDRPRLVSRLIGRASNGTGPLSLASAPVTSPPHAARDLEEALRLAGEMASAPDQAWANYVLGDLATMHGHFGHALENIQSAIRIASDIGHRHIAVGAHLTLGMLYAELFALDEARRQFDAALTLARKLRSPTWIQALFGALAGVYIMLDDQKSAQDCLETAISPHTLMDTIGKRYCWMMMAELALIQDEPTLTIDITDRLIESAPGMSHGRIITSLWKLKGKALAITGYEKDALSLLLAARENAKKTGERFLMWRIHACLQHLYQSMGHQQAAEKEIEIAREIIDELAISISDELLKDQFYQGAYRILETPLPT